MLRSTPSFALRTRVRLVLAVFALAVAAAILLTPSAAVHADDGTAPFDAGETAVFTDGEGGVFGSGDNFDVYCVYKIVESNCEKFQPGDVICINCPENNICPTKAGTIGNWKYLNADGEVECQGTWSRRFDIDNPDACIVCDGGKTGYEFVH